MLGEAELARGDHILKLSHILRSKGDSACDHGVKENSKTPNIRLEPLVAVFVKNLGGNVSWCSALLQNGLGKVIEGARDAKVAHFNISVLVQQDVVKLNVAMED